MGTITKNRLSITNMHILLKSCDDALLFTSRNLCKVLLIMHDYKPLFGMRGMLTIKYILQKKSSLSTKFFQEIIVLVALMLHKYSAAIQLQLANTVSMQNLLFSITTYSKPLKIR